MSMGGMYLEFDWPPLRTSRKAASKAATNSYGPWQKQAYLLASCTILRDEKYASNAFRKQLQANFEGHCR